jgi:hypothetical protein
MLSHRSLFIPVLAASVALSVDVIASPSLFPPLYPIDGKIAVVNRSAETVDLSTATDSILKTVNGKEFCEVKYKIVTVTLKSSNALRKVERGLSPEQLRLGDIVSLGHQDFGLGFGKANPVVIGLNPVTLKLRQLPSSLSKPSFKIKGSMQSQEMKFGDVVTIAMKEKGLPLSAVSAVEPAILTVNKPQEVQFSRLTRINFKDLAVGQTASLQLTVHPQGLRKADSFDVIIENKAK